MLPEASALSEALQRDFALSPVIATEIEFYLIGHEQADMASFWQQAAELCAARGVELLKHEAEKGLGQYEVALAMQREAADAVAQAESCKSILSETAARLGMKADFSAKPYAGQPGSGLHVHVHLEDAQGQNVFYKKDDAISDALKHSIGGLLATMREYFPFFAPAAESLARFKPGGNAPTTISWGANNRTVAIRLPDEGAPFRHIEHRVAGADAQIGQVVAAVLAGILHGLHAKCDPGPQIYGDANLAMYGLERLVPVD